MKTFRKILAGVAILYLGALTGLFAFQRHIIYRPANHPYLAPEQLSSGNAFKEMHVTTADGLGLVGWYAPATTQDTTLVFFHGNGDSLDTVWGVAGPYLDAGYGFLLAEYRGYSQLPGSPDEDGLYADGRAFIKKLIEDGVEENSIVLMGHSLGTGVATQLASEFKVGGLMLIAPFLSAPEMAQERYPYFPAKWLTLDAFDNGAKVGKLKIPVLVGVSGKDRVVPVEQEQRLFEIANEPKKLFFAPESGHSGQFEAGLYPASLEWLQALKYADVPEAN